jgi:hypothetical protein
MNTSAESLRDPWLIEPKIIVRRCGLALLLLGALWLGACSTTRLAYNQAPNVLYWWLDGFVDFQGTQSAQARQDIDAFLTWHRSTELPTYARQLQQWQALADQDISPAQVCAQFEAVRAAVQRASERGVEPLTRLAQQLSREQVAHLQRKHDKSNDAFEAEYLRGSPEQRMGRRVDKAMSRSEKLYGRLSPAQREMVQQGLQQSPWDPQKTQQERLRRQIDLLQTIQTLQSPANGNPLEASRGYLNRILQTPTAGYNANSHALVQHGCAQFALLHNTTTAEQRANAVRVLKGYEDDMRALAAQR